MSVMKFQSKTTEDTQHFYWIRNWILVLCLRLFIFNLHKLISTAADTSTAFGW